MPVLSRIKIKLDTLMKDKEFLRLRAQSVPKKKRELADERDKKLMKTLNQVTKEARTIIALHGNNKEKLKACGSKWEKKRREVVAEYQKLGVMPYKKPVSVQI